MDDETIRTLISCGSTLLVSVISNVFLFITTRHNNKKSIDISVYKEQYEKVFAPIHKIIFFDKLKDNRLKYNYIKSIISNNYHIVPKSIIHSFSNIKNIDENIENFENDISICTDYLRKILGYSKIKLSNAETKKAKRIISYKSEDFILNRTSAICVLISMLLTVIISYFLFFVIENTVLFCIITFLILIGLCISMALIYYLINNKK